MLQCRGTEGREVGVGGLMEEHPHRSREREDGIGKISNKKKTIERKSM